MKVDRHTNKSNSLLLLLPRKVLLQGLEDCALCVYVRSLCEPAGQDPCAYMYRVQVKTFNPVRAVRGASFPVRT